MQLDILQSDINSKVCQRCAACCRIYLTISNTDTRYRQFLRKIGYKVHPENAEGKDDCCNDRHDITLDMGYCRHLETSSDEMGRTYNCKLYGTSDFPQMCKDFDCVSWAKHGDAYNEKNETLTAAQRALNQVRRIAAREFSPDVDSEPAT